MSPTSLIILVEDDASMSLAIKRLLEAVGWKTMAFLSGEALLESGGAPEAHGFIFDVNLPGLDGFALREKLVGKGIVAPFIFITGQDRPGVRAQAERAGAAGYFVKPFSGAHLIDTLKQTCAAA